MTAWAILDTGPIVAFLEKGEQSHNWACDQFASFDPGMLTCEPVITETLFILRRRGHDHAQLMKLLERGVIKIGLSLASHLDEIRRMMDQYAKLPMSLADACIVCMAEMNPRAEIVTLDRHFRVYRTSDRRVLRLRTPGF